MVILKDKQRGMSSVCLTVFILIVFLGGCNTTDEKKVPSDYIDYDAPFIPPPQPDGFVRLILNEKLGSFSLSYVPNAYNSVYEPLFISRNPGSSYMTLSFNGKFHRLGKSRDFKTRIVRYEGDPALVFNSPFITVTQVFAPVRTGNSQNANGIMITITVTNTSAEPALIGLKFLLDTALGEQKGMTPFVTENHVITNETVVDGYSGEKFWMSKGEDVSLMGSIVNPVDSGAVVPDFIHFANWKRLNDVPWKLNYAEGRSFTNLPYSINDSAVCYFYEPVEMAAGSSSIYTIFLTTEDIAWISPPKQEVTNVYIISESSLRNVNIASIEQEALQDALRNNEHPSVITLKRMQEILNLFVVGDVSLTEQDIAEIERIIHKHSN